LKTVPNEGRFGGGHLQWCVYQEIAQMGRTCRYLVFIGLLSSSCALPLRMEIEQIKAEHPDIVASVQSSGLADEMPSEDLGECGPNAMWASVIPDCPLPGICFTAACANHDLCYSTCGTHQASCDQVFFWDLVYLCDSQVNDIIEQDRCYSLAWIYYRAVEMYGNEFFPGTQAIVCARDEQARMWPADGQVFEASARSADMNGVCPFVDNDDDLLPDDWEVCVGLDPTDPADAWLDYDGDGLVNLAEYTHGSDPYAP
jgi:hypothetical protein